MNALIINQPDAGFGGQRPAWRLTVQVAASDAAKFVIEGGQGFQRAPVAVSPRHGGANLLDLLLVAPPSASSLGWIIPPRGGRGTKLLVACMIRRNCVLRLFG